MTKILTALPNWARAGITTGVFVALPGFIATITDWSSDFFAYVAGTSVSFPDVSTLRAAAVSVAAGAVSGGLNATYRWAQEKAGRGTPPVYPTQQRGA